MPTYQLTDNPDVVLRSDGWSIPADPRNADYQQYLVWIADCNIPEPAHAQ